MDTKQFINLTFFINDRLCKISFHIPNFLYQTTLIHLNLYHLVRMIKLLMMTDDLNAIHTERYKRFYSGFY